MNIKDLFVVRDWAVGGYSMREPILPTSENTVITADEVIIKDPEKFKELWEETPRNPRNS